MFLVARTTSGHEIFDISPDPISFRNRQSVPVSSHFLVNCIYGKIRRQTKKARRSRFFDCHSVAEDHLGANRSMAA
jgi:hypothetical protein